MHQASQSHDALCNGTYLAHPGADGGPAILLESQPGRPVLSKCLFYWTVARAFESRFRSLLRSPNIQTATFHVKMRFRNSDRRIVDLFAHLSNHPEKKGMRVRDLGKSSQQQLSQENVALVFHSMPLLAQPIVKYGAQNTRKGNRRPSTRPELRGVSNAIKDQL